MAQLPYLIYEQKPPMSSENFKELALSLLDKNDAALMSNISKDFLSSDSNKPDYEMNVQLTGCDFIDQWRNWERTLRLNIARERAIKIKRDHAEIKEPPVFPADAVNAAIKVVVGDGSPLDKEILLDKARWGAIDIFTGNDNFHRNCVFAYFLKLILMERRQSFNVEKGFTEYKSLYANVLDNSKDCMQNYGQNVGESK
jgi:hypothetical protein